MMRITHHLFGAYAGAGVAWAVHQQPWQIVASAAAAATFAGGLLSPDVDQYKVWRRLDKWLPDEQLGHGGPLQHRGISHWWGLPALVALGLVIAQQITPSPFWWLAWAVVVGWTSHLAGDFIFGKASPYDHRGPGIPVAPWWNHVGIGLGASGPLEGFSRGLMALGPFVALAWHPIIEPAIALAMPR